MKRLPHEAGGAVRLMELTLDKPEPLGRRCGPNAPRLVVAEGKVANAVF